MPIDPPRLLAVNPKLPARDLAHTREFYVNSLGFTVLADYPAHGYLMLSRDHIELHFFSFPALDTAQNYGQVYIRTSSIEQLYASFQSAGVPIHPNGALQVKAWGQMEFSLLDPDNNLLTFGQPVE